MAAIIQDNSAEQEYLWSCTLSGSSKEYTWNPEDPADTAEDDEKDPSVKPGHRLLIKAAVLMPSAKKDEVTIVQIESEGYKKEKVVVPICAMKGGQNLHQYVDLLVPTQAKFSLLQGEGPINLVGSHCVDFFGYRETDEDEDESAEEDAEMDGVEETGGESNDVKKKTPTKDTAEDKKKTPAKESGDEKKRKASTDPKSAEKKKKESPAK